MKSTIALGLVTLAAVGCAGAPSADPPAPLPPVVATPVAEAPAAAAARVATVDIEPSPVVLTRGDTVVIHGVLRDASGAVVSGARWGITNDGTFDVQSIKEQQEDSYLIWGIQPGEGELGVFAGLEGETPDQPNWVQMAAVRVRIFDYPVAMVEIEPPRYRPYVATSFALRGRAITTMGDEHAEERVTWSTSDAAIATVSPDGVVSALRTGQVSILGAAGGQENAFSLDIIENPARTVTLDVSETQMRTGDVVRLASSATDGAGNPVAGLALGYEVTALRGGDAEGAVVFEDGAFVAEAPGQYRITVNAGAHTASADLTVFAREAERQTSLVGHGPVGTATSDLWVFEGLDGRDYAYTGTMNAATMYAFDVTDPGSPLRTDSVVVDGRRVNDVKINDDRTIAIITSENASNRRNGITLLDIKNPRHPTIITHYTEGLTGGVHNVWFVGDLVYAINDGTLDVHIIDISDPTAPFEAGRWGLENQNRYLHDVSVVDGLAYLSYWDDGLVILDVGAGIKGGTPTVPQFVSSLKYRYAIGNQTYGNTHHAIRYGNYVFLGDEIFGCSECDPARGYIHVIDVSDIETPVEVANFKLPDAGTHNLWVEDDLLYIAYYQGGLRVVDVSGELRGDLLAQGRQVASFMTEDEGTGSTMAWGPQPYKGNVFVSDMSTGLWVLKVQPARVIP